MIKRGLCALLLAALLMAPVGARAEATATAAATAAASATAAPTTDASTAPDEAQDVVYTIYDESGNYLTSIYGRVYVGDEYITGDDQLYQVISVDDARREAVARYMGPEDMTGLIDDAVATVATDAKRMVAIYSTHSDESYVPTDGTESKLEDPGIFDVNEALKEELEARGIEVEMDLTTHLPHDAGAYRRSRVTATRLMETQPAALLDIHRDGIPDPDEYIQEIEGEDATKIRLLVGRSNPNAAANRKFAKQIKAVADEMYPELIKDIYIGKGDYNQELMPRAILLEFGTHTLKKERAITSTEFMADVLERVLFGTTANAQGATDGTATGADTTNGASDGDAATQAAQAEAESGGSGALWGILVVVGVAIAAIVIYGIVTTGSVGGMWEKVKRGVSETTGGLLGRKKDRDRHGE